MRRIANIRTETTRTLETSTLNNRNIPKSNMSICCAGGNGRLGSQEQQDRKIQKAIGQDTLFTKKIQEMEQDCIKICMGNSTMPVNNWERPKNKNIADAASIETWVIPNGKTMRQLIA